MPHTPADRPVLIDAIRVLPSQLEQAVAGLSDEQLDFRPAPGEWSVRQIVHHVADSHMNSFIRCKWLLTEDNPTIKPYDQDVCAELADYQPPVDLSLMLLKGLHARWVALFASLTPEQWSRRGQHPESGEITLDSLLDYYAWHGQNHIEQIERNLATFSKR